MGATGEERDRLVFKTIPAIFTFCKSHYHEEKGFRGNHGRVRVRVIEKFVLTGVLARVLGQILALMLVYLMI